MLNALPDSRANDEMNTEIFLTNHERFHNHVGHIDLKKVPIYDEQKVNNWSGKHSSPLALQDTPAAAPSTRPAWECLLAEGVAELLGTAILVLVGCAGVAQYVLSSGQRSIFLSVDFAFGFGAMIAVYVAGPVSGAHINPAVSISMLTIRSITVVQCLTYIAAQFLGAFLAATFIFGIYYDAIEKFDNGTRQVEGNTSTAGIFGTFPEKDIGQACQFFDQLVSTALLLVAVCSLSDKRNKLVSNAQIPLAVGFVITAIGVSFGYNCGFPINPARDFGPRLFTYMAGYGSEVFTAGDHYFWIPLISPVIGALIGTWIYQGYSRLIKIHVGENEHHIVHTRRQLDLHNTTRI